MADNERPDHATAPAARSKRGGEITRLEALSDATFAIAITLLVVSLEVPSTFEELASSMRGFGAFAICFSYLVWIWFQHTRFFRRYHLQDAFTVALNSLLLFVVLFSCPSSSRSPAGRGWWRLPGCPTG